MESWKDIRGYEGRYQISNFGNVRSLPRAHARLRTLKPYLEPRTGYLKVTFSDNGVNRKHTIHVLVASEFLGKRPLGYDIDHRDRNKQNNNLTNLRYITRSMNCLNAGLPSNNSSGYRGVSFNGKTRNLKKWNAYIKLSGVKKNLGYHSTAKLAHAARKAYITKLGLSDFATV